MSARWFLKIDGIVGQSVDVAHKNEIDVLSWSWGVARDDDTASTGRVASKPGFGDFRFVANLSTASPVLFASCATGARHKFAELSGVRAAGSGTPREFLRYKLSDVIVSSIQLSAADDLPIEEISLNYAKIEVVYTPQDAKGAAGPAVKAGFDLTANKTF